SLAGEKGGLAGDARQHVGGGAPHAGVERALEGAFDGQRAHLLARGRGEAHATPELERPRLAVRRARYRARELGSGYEGRWPLPASTTRPHTRRGSSSSISIENNARPYYA